MLELLKKMNLKDTVVIVTRYFGGIKLGAGGLIRAYGQATKEGVLAAGIIQRSLHKEIFVTVDYTWHGKLENEMNNRGYTISNTEFMEHVKMTLLTLEEEEDHFIQLLTNLTNGQASITTGDLVYLDKPVESSIEEE
jgi:putative IMPACT (imprinted ancient) family translation regulator